MGTASGAHSVFQIAFGPGAPLVAGFPYTLWWGTFDGTTWAADASIPSSYSVVQPTLASFNGYIYMLTQQTAKGTVYMTRFDPRTKTWYAPFALPFTSAGAPGIIAYGGKLYILGTSPATSQLFMATMDPSEIFTPAQSIPYQYGKAAPALAIFNNKLFMVHYRGTFDDLVYNSFDGVSWGADVSITEGAGGAKQLAKTPPTIASYGGNVHMVYKDYSSDRIRWSYFNGSTWAASATIPNQQMHGGGSLAALSNKLVLTHQSSDSGYSGGDYAIWYATFQ